MAGRLSAIHLDEGSANTTSPTNSSRLIRSYACNTCGEIEKITDNTSFLTGGALTTELAYTYNDYGLPVKQTYTDVDGETSTVREETNLTYDGNGNILAEAVTEAYSGSTTKTRMYQYDLGNRLISAMSPRTILSWIRGETPERDRRAYILRKCRTVEISQDSRAESIYFYKWR